VPVEVAATDARARAGVATGSGGAPRTSLDCRSSAGRAAPLRRRCAGPRALPRECDGTAGRSVECGVGVRVIPGCGGDRPCVWAVADAKRVRLSQLVVGSERSRH
jgi:hypothetical protein